MRADSETIFQNPEPFVTEEVTQVDIAASGVSYLIKGS